MKRTPAPLTALPSALAALLLLPLTASADWTRQFGSSALDIGYGVAIDADGNVFSGGGTTGAILGQTSNGSGDAFLAKRDSAGNLLWARQFGTSATDYSLALTRIGTHSVASGGYTAGSLPGYTSAGSDDAFVRLFDGSGNTTWTRQFGTAASDQLFGLAADSLGHLYATGTTLGSFAGYTNAGNTDLFVSQLDAATGAVNWTFQLGSSTFDTAYGLAADALGNVYIAGQTAGTLPGQTSSGSHDAFLLKLDISGALQWTRQFGTAGSDTGTAVAVDSTGAILLAGIADGALPGETSAGLADIFVRQYDTTGTELWTNQLGTASVDYARGIAIASTGEIVLGGQTSGLFPGQTTPNSSEDALAVVLQSDGTFTAARQLGGTTGLTVNSGGVAVDPSGNIYLTGNTSGVLPGQTNAGSSDVFLIQFTAVPEPATATFLLGGLTLLGLHRRRG